MGPQEQKRTSRRKFLKSKRAPDRGPFRSLFVVTADIGDIVKRDVAIVGVIVEEIIIKISAFGVIIQIVVINHIGLIIIKCRGFLGNQGATTAGLQAVSAENSSACRAGHRIVLEVVEACAAMRAQAFRTPFLFGHGNLFQPGLGKSELHCHRQRRVSKAFPQEAHRRGMTSRQGSEQGRLIIDGDIEVALRRSSRARRMTLRVARAGGAVVLTLPRAASLADARAFAESRAGWLRKTRAAVPEIKAVHHGGTIPYAGRQILLTPIQTKLVRLEDDRLLMPANRPAGIVAAAWLKHIARQKLARACDRYAARLGRPYKALALRDTRSRWGSCTHEGRLMFSWRLAMAPDAVLDYVAAHEVAHLRHMDHSAEFWACCEALMPGHAPHRAWLKQHGHELLALVFET